MQHCNKGTIPQKNLQGMTNNAGTTFSVGVGIPRFIISIEQDNQNWWHYIPYLMYLGSDSYYNIVNL